MQLAETIFLNQTVERQNTDRLLNKAVSIIVLINAKNMVTIF